MFHPLWDDVGGTLAVSQEKREKSQACQLCEHSTATHRSNGACYAEGCLCGWTRDLTGQLYVKLSGDYVGDVSIKRKRNRGARVGVHLRLDILKIPCYFCGDKPNTIDHLIARAKGGTSERANLVSACDVCNCMKSDRSYDELLYFCRQLEDAVTRKTALKRVQRFVLFKEQAKKILSWHEKRMASKQLPVV